MPGASWTLLDRAVRLIVIRRRTHAFRVLSIVLILLFLIVAHFSSGLLGAPGQQFFRLIAWLDVALITLAGIGFFAPCITEEKEEGTLGLIRLAGSTSLGILLGKSVGRLFDVSLFLVAQFPFAILALLLGGLSFRQLVLTYVVLLAYLVLVASAGLLISVVSRNSKVAESRAIMLAVVGLFLLPVLQRLIVQILFSRLVVPGTPYLQALDDLLEKWQSCMPYHRVSELLSISSTGAEAWPYAGGCLLVAAVLFGIAWFVFDRITIYTDSTEARRTFVPRTRRRNGFIVQRPWKNPFCWKDFSFVAGGPVMFAVKLVLFSAMMVGIWYFDGRITTFVGGGKGLSLAPPLSVAVLLVMLALESCVIASRLLHDELQQGTLSTLLMTPHTIGKIMYSKLAGAALGQLPAVCLLLLVHLFYWRELDAIYQWAYVPKFWFIAMSVVVILHLTVLFSLMVKSGALPLAVGTYLLCGFCASPILLPMMMLSRSGVSDDAIGVGAIIYTGCMSAAVLQALIAQRLFAHVGR